MLRRYVVELEENILTSILYHGKAFAGNKIFLLTIMKITPYYDPAPPLKMFLKLREHNTKSMIKHCLPENHARERIGMGLRLRSEKGHGDGKSVR